MMTQRQTEEASVTEETTATEATERPWAGRNIWGWAPWRWPSWF